MRYTALTLPVFLLGCSSAPAPLQPESVPCVAERTFEDEANSVYANLTVKGVTKIPFGDFSHWFDVFQNSLDQRPFCDYEPCGLGYEMHDANHQDISLQFTDGVPLSSLDSVALCYFSQDHKCKPLLKTKDTELLRGTNELLLRTTINYFNNTRDPALETELIKAYDFIMQNEGY